MTDARPNYLRLTSPIIYWDQLGQLMVTYNASREKRELKKLISTCVKEEGRLKRERGESAHLVQIRKWIIPIEA